METPGTGAELRRFRRSGAISWSFSPGSPPRRPHGAETVEEGNEPRSTPLLVWIDCEERRDFCEFPTSDGPGEINRLHVILNGDPTSPRATELTEMLAELSAVVALLEETYAISPDHVYLAGAGEGGGGAAWRLSLMRPARFRGIALMDAGLPALSESVAFDHRRMHQRVLLVSSIGSQAKGCDVLAFGRLLHSAGMRITTRFYFSESDSRLGQERRHRDLADWVTGERCRTPYRLPWSG